MVQCFAGMEDSTQGHCIIVSEWEILYTKDSCA